MEINKDVRESGSIESRIEFAFSFSEAEIDSVFAANQEILFSKIFSPKWEKLTDSEKMEQYVALQKFLESQASNINLSGGTVVPK